MLRRDNSALLSNGVSHRSLFSSVTAFSTAPCDGITNHRILLERAAASYLNPDAATAAAAGILLERAAASRENSSRGCRFHGTPKRRKVALLVHFWTHALESGLFILRPIISRQHGPSFRRRPVLAPPFVSVLRVGPDGDR